MNVKLASALAAGLLVVGFSAPADAQYRDRDRGYNDGYYAMEDGYRRDYRRTRCGNCGTVQRIEREYYGDGRRDRDDGTGGAVVGALVGAALGNQVGSGNGRKAATVAGAIAGGVAGKRIDERNGSRGHDEFEVVVRMDNGRTVVLEQRDLNGVREGSRVVVNGGVARLQ
jgi:outer membrane lipoprotein SlyB